MQVYSKKELIAELRNLAKCAKKSNNNATFHASFIFSGISSSFLELKKKHNIKETTISVTPEIFTKQSILKQLDDMISIAVKSEDDAIFTASFSCDELDPKFMELARQFNISKAQEAQKQLEQSNDRGQGNI